MKLGILLFSLVFASSGALAGPEKIKYPSDYLKGVLYQTLDRPDTKQYRELYATPAAIDAILERAAAGAAGALDAPLRTLADDPVSSSPR